jgi:hypothetical protein
LKDLICLISHEGVRCERGGEEGTGCGRGGGAWWEQGCQMAVAKAEYSNPAFNHPHIQIHVRCINKTTFKWALKAHLLEDLVEN